MASSTACCSLLPGHRKEIRAHKNKATEYLKNTLSAWRALSASSNVLLVRLTFPRSEHRVGMNPTSSARESKPQPARRNGAESSSILSGSCYGVETVWFTPLPVHTRLCSVSVGCQLSWIGCIVAISCHGTCMHIM